MPFGIRFRPKSSLLLFTSGVILYKLTSELVIEELGITSVPEDRIGSVCSSVLYAYQLL